MDSGQLHPERVPGAEEAVAEARKFTNYLLDENHPVGRGKARFFKTIGYDRSNWKELRLPSWLNFLRSRADTEGPTPSEAKTTKPCSVWRRQQEKRTTSGRFGKFIHILVQGS